MTPGEKIGAITVVFVLFLTGMGLHIWTMRWEIQRLESQLDAGVPEERPIPLTPEEEIEVQRSVTYKAMLDTAVKYKRVADDCVKELKKKVPTCNEVCPDKFEQGRVVGHLDYSETMDCYTIDCPKSEKGCVPMQFNEEGELEEVRFIPAPPRQPEPQKSKREP